MHRQCLHRRGGAGNEVVTARPREENKDRLILKRRNLIEAFYPKVTNGPKNVGRHEIPKEDGGSTSHDTRCVLRDRDRLAEQTRERLLRHGVRLEQGSTRLNRDPHEVSAGGATHNEGRVG